MNLIKFLKVSTKAITEARLSFDLKALYFNRFLQLAAASLLGLFLPIFLFEELGRSIQNVLIFYILSYLLVGLFIPLGAKIMSKIGLKPSMILGTIFLAAYYLCFYYFQISLYLFLGLALIAVTFFRIFYWVPYHTNFAQFTVPKQRGRQIAFLSSLTFLVGIIAPISAGFIIEHFGFKTVFLMAVITVLLSVFSLFPIKKIYEKYSYSYFQTFKELFKKSKNRKLLIGYGADGAQAVVGIIIWPIFIYQILNEQYVAVGAISSVIVSVTVVLQLVMGNITDRMPKRKLMRVGTTLFAIGWIIKIFIQTGFQIFIVSTYHSFAGAIRGIPFSAFIYEEMADQGHYIDEYTVLREVSMNLGRIIMLIACFVLIGFVGLSWTFFLAAIASLLINVL